MGVFEWSLHSRRSFARHAEAARDGRVVRSLFRHFVFVFSGVVQLVRAPL